MLMRLRKKAQNTAEYAIVLGLVVGAVVAMQVYVKRGLQGRIQQFATYNDSAVNDNWSADMNFKEQYEPYYLDSEFEVDRQSDGYGRIDTDVGAAAFMFRNETSNVTRAKDGSQQYLYNTSLEFILNETD